MGTFKLNEREVSGKKEQFWISKQEDLEKLSFQKYLREGDNKPTKKEYSMMPYNISYILT